MGQLFSLCCTERVKVMTCVRCKNEVKLGACFCDLCRILEPYEFEAPNLINL